MTQFDISLNNYKIRELSRTSPYLEQSGNIDVRWPVFNHRAEIAFLLCIVEMQFPGRSNAVGRNHNFLWFVT